MTSTVSHAFPFEDPTIELRWGLCEKAFKDHFRSSALTKVTAGHFTTRCRLLGGIVSAVHFHFSPRQDGCFAQVELYRRPKRHRQRSFDDWQARLTSLFGVGQKQFPQWPMDIAYHWQVGRVLVTHRWYYYCGEHERILFTCKNP